mgnify:CR=1 FL=1
MFWSTSLQSSGLQDLLKRFLPKLSAIRTLRLCHSLCLRHLRKVICFHLRVLPLSVCLLYVIGLLYHSIFRKNQTVLSQRSQSINGMPKPQRNLKLCGVHRGLLTSGRVNKLYVIMATTYSLVTLSTRPLVNTSTRQLTLLNTLI